MGKIYPRIMQKTCLAGCPHYVPRQKDQYDLCDAPEFHDEVADAYITRHILKDLDYYAERFPGVRNYVESKRYRQEKYQSITDLWELLETDFKFSDCPVYRAWVVAEQAKEDAEAQPPPDLTPPAPLPVPPPSEPAEPEAQSKGGWSLPWKK